MPQAPSEFENDAGDWHERIGRAGFVAQGVLYGIVGVIAIAVALDGGKVADQTGALRSLADHSLGKALLVALALGLGAYAIFRLVEVFVGSETEEGARDKAERAASVVRFVVYGSLCVSAVRLLADAGKGGGNESKTTSTVFSLPAGVVLVFAAGAVMIVVGGLQARKAATGDFQEDLDGSRMSPRMRKLAKPLGIAGHAARAVVFALIGGFLIKAAVEHDAKEAVGLDGALREIAQQTLGPVLLLIVAVGLFTYGAYSLLEARYRKL